jgi:phenylacetate-coenzyme A ligase PaaK-like adenylate-forming protein
MDQGLLVRGSVDQVSDSMWERMARLRRGKTDREIEQALSFVVRSAAANVPFWRDRLRTARFEMPLDLPGLPITTREELLAVDSRERIHRGAASRRAC